MRLLPKTLLGKWSVGLIIIFFLAFAIFFAFVNLGEKGGETFFSNLRLAIPALVSAISPIAAFFAGFWSILKSKERSVAVFLATLIGFLVLTFVLGEILYPH